MQRNYNFIYTKLVHGEEDMIGHIAYSLYKKHKIEYINSKKVEGQELTDEDLKPFNDISSVDSAIQNYRIQAELILQDFTNEALEESLTEMQEQAILNQTIILKDVVKELTPGFWKNVWIGLVSSFIFSLVLALIAFIIHFQGSDINISIDKKTTNSVEKTGD